MLDRADIVDCLAATFRCAPEVAGTIETSTILRSHAPGAQIFGQGQAIRHCWIVVTGTARSCSLSIDGQQTQLMTFSPGEIFGAFPEERRSLFEVHAIDKLELLQIETGRLRDIAGIHTPVAFRLATMFAGQLHIALDRLAARVALTANGRVYAELLQLADGRQLISPCPSVTSLAVMAQTTRETASRAINALERRGIVQRGVDGLTILSPRMLAEMLV